MSKLLNARYILCLACIVFFACKKNDVSTPSHEITYKIIAADYTLFSDIVYVINSDSLIRGSAKDSTTSWTKHANAETTPFYAKIVALVNNTTPISFSYTLQIFVDNKKMAEQSETALSNSVSDASAEYIIE